MCGAIGHIVPCFGMDKNISALGDGSLTKERLGQTVPVKKQIDTLLGGGDQWVCHGTAQAAPQTELILHVDAPPHHDYQC